MCKTSTDKNPMLDLVSHHDGPRGQLRTGQHKPLIGSHLLQDHQEQVESI